MTLSEVNTRECIRAIQMTFRIQYGELRNLKSDWQDGDRTEPAPDSTMLRSDDNIARYIPRATDGDLRISVNASTIVRLALDQASFAGYLVLKTKEWPPLAAFSYLRGAIEAAAQGVWLLGSNDPDVRLHRNFSLIMADVEDRARMANKRGEHRPAYAREVRREDEKIAELTDAVRATARTCGVTEPLVRPRSAEMLDAACDSCTTRVPVLRLWRTCSALAHARPWSITSFDLNMWANEHVHDLRDKECGAEELMQDGMNGAVSLIRHLIWLYDEAAGRQHVVHPS